MKNVFFLIILLLCGLRTFAQVIPNENVNSTKEHFSFENGIGITAPDSAFNVNIHFRMQDRITYYQSEYNQPRFEGRVRTVRLKFDGFVYNPRFQYLLQLGFAPGDIGTVHDGDNVNILCDAAVNFKIDRHFRLVFGQTKLPGNRQRLVPSGALHLTDRSINNAHFTLDRDFGLQLFYLEEKEDAFSYTIRSAVSSGDGRNYTHNMDGGLAYTAKVELLPLGTFTKDGAYIEGDIYREPRAKLFFSGAYQYNDKANRTQGETGQDLYSMRTMQSYFLDGLMKYRGLYLSVAYMSRTCLYPVTFLDFNIADVRYVYTGYGLDYEASYYFKSKIECIARYSQLRPSAQIFKYTPQMDEYTFGLSRYIREHTFKIQLEQSLDKVTNRDSGAKYSWFTRLQVEIGI